MRFFKLPREKRVLFSGAVVCCLLSAGCFSTDFAPTYKEADIPVSIKKICREEYQLNVVPIRVGNTLWVYAPQPRLLHAEFGKNPEKIFDEQMVDKARNILTSISRVLLSSDNAPEFSVLVLSDINIGLDYSLTAYLQDIKRSAAGGLPWTESNKRYVIGFEQAVKAIGDTRGEHLKIYDIKLPEFLARQIIQRIRMFSQEEAVKKYFTLKEVNASFKDKVLSIEYSMDRLSQPKEQIDISKRILDIVTYCFKTYEFKEFRQVRIHDLVGGRTAVYESKDIWSRSIE
jgi:hypothetical protein